MWGSIEHKTGTTIHTSRKPIHAVHCDSSSIKLICNSIYMAIGVIAFGWAWHCFSRQFSALKLLQDATVMLQDATPGNFHLYTFLQIHFITPAASHVCIALTEWIFVYCWAQAVSQVAVPKTAVHAASFQWQTLYEWSLSRQASW